jgi:D-xylose 1-dehydrogenase (NADP+, D-xylono-1,5-lactone-forming)
MSTPVRWGILSTANINRHVIPAAHASDKAEPIAVASRNQGRAEAYAQEWDIERAYGTYDALLDDPDVEAVYISLPNSMHVEWSIRCLEAGKHVLCEKPLDRRPTEVERAYDVAERDGLLLMEAFMYRHNPQTHQFAELVSGGAVGELRVIRSTFSFSVYDPEDIRLQPELDGGSLMDVGCYCVSGSRLLAGEPTTVHGEAFIGPSGTDWVFAGMMRFPGDVIAQFDCGTALPLRDELEAVGTEGSLFLEDPWHCRTPVIELRRGDEVEGLELDRADSYLLQLENFSDAVRGAGAPWLGREDAVAQARVLDALFRSAESGAPVRLD